jgi:hypothetical protein
MSLMSLQDKYWTGFLVSEARLIRLRGLAPPPSTTINFPSTSDASQLDLHHHHHHTHPPNRQVPPQLCPSWLTPITMPRRLPVRTNLPPNDAVLDSRQQSDIPAPGEAILSVSALLSSASSLSFQRSVADLLDAEIKKRRAFRKFTFRGIDLDQYGAHETTLGAMVMLMIWPTDSSTSLPNSCAMSSTPVLADDSTVA